MRLAFVRPERDAAAQIEAGAADLVIAPAAQAPGALMMRSLLDSDFLTAQRKGHPRGTGPLDLDVFWALDHLVVSMEGGGFSGVVDRTLAVLGRTRRVVLSIHNYGLAPLIVAGEAAPVRSCAGSRQRCGRCAMKVASAGPQTSGWPSV